MATEFRVDLARPSYRGSSAPLDPERCKAGVHSSDRWSKYSQCKRKADRDGWCKQHHPDAEKAREEASAFKYRQEQRLSAMGWYGDRLLKALIKIRDGDNDPRATAAEALKSCPYADPPKS